MSQQARLKLFGALGMLLISGSFIIKQFFHATDFWQGLMSGAGIGMLLMTVYKSQKLRKQMERQNQQ